MKTLLFLLCLATCPAEDNINPAYVKRILDGDTIKVVINEKEEYVRLLHIDAPEKDQPHSQLATVALINFLEDRAVVVRWKYRDKYKRILGEVWVGNLNINLYLTSIGYVWACNVDKNSAAYGFAQLEAQRIKDGIWKFDDNIEPKKWRLTKKLVKKGLVK